MTLANVKKQRLNQPIRILVYSAEGVGKTTLAAHADEPIFLDADGGSAHLEVARYPFRDGADGHVPRTYDEVLDAIDVLTESDHGYKTLVVDTVDALEPLIWRFICKRESGEKSNLNPKAKQLTSIEAFGYGKGFLLAVDEWRAFCVRLDRLRAKRGMNIIMLSHSQVRLFKNPVAEDFDRIQLRVQDKAAGFLKEWSDVVGYLAFEESVALMMEEEDKSSARLKGFATGRRLLHTSRTAAFDAKSRIPLPTEVEIPPGDPWVPLAAALEVGRHSSPEDLTKLIAKELRRIGDHALAKQVRTEVKKVSGQAPTLSRYLNELKTRPTKSKEETTNA